MPDRESAALIAQEPDDIDLMDLCQCQGCGQYRSTAWLGRSHACHLNEDGTYEEGGTFQ